jgi:primosomal replication protein N
MQNVPFLPQVRWKMRACGTGRKFGEYEQRVMPYDYIKIFGFLIRFSSGKQITFSALPVK